MSNATVYAKQKKFWKCTSTSCVFMWVQVVNKRATWEIRFTFKSLFCVYDGFESNFKYRLPELNVKQTVARAVPEMRGDARPVAKRRRCLRRLFPTRMASTNVVVLADVLPLKKRAPVFAMNNSLVFLESTRFENRVSPMYGAAKTIPIITVIEQLRPKLGRNYYRFRRNVRHTRSGRSNKY